MRLTTSFYGIIGKAECKVGTLHRRLYSHPSKRSRRNFEAGQAIKLGIGGGGGGSLRAVKVSPGDRWAWLMLDSQVKGRSRPNFRCGQGVKHENLLGQDLDRGCGWKYRRLCSVSPPPPPPPRECQNCKRILLYGTTWYWMIQCNCT